MKPQGNEGDELTRQTRDYYDSLIGDIGEGYLESRWKSNPISASHYRHTEAEASRLLEQFGPVDSILEVGCGPGTWTPLCRAASKKATLFDVSEEMLSVARSRFGDDPSIQYVCGDFVEPPASLEGTFDLVFSARALEYMSDKGTAVASFWNCLRPGGVAILITKNPRWYDKRRAERRLKTAAPAESDIQRDWIYWSRLMDLMRERGFDELRATPVALGSYEWPIPARVGTWLSTLIRAMWGRRRMHRALDWIVESYAVVGRKPAD